MTWQDCSVTSWGDISQLNISSFRTSVIDREIIVRMSTISHFFSKSNTNQTGCTSSFGNVHRREEICHHYDIQIEQTNEAEMCES
jgi:hypothetical protein